MVNLARKNALRAKTSNVTFIHSLINDLPLPANSVDCIISNCVLNLVPETDKASVFTDIHRVLKPGGRLAASDFLAYKPLPPAIKEDPALQVGCVSGACTLPRMRELLSCAGFIDVLLVDSHKDINIYKDDGEKAVSVAPCCSGETSCGPMRASGSGRKQLDYDLNEWIGMFSVFLPNAFPPWFSIRASRIESSQAKYSKGAFQIYAVKTDESTRDGVTAVVQKGADFAKAGSSGCCCKGGSC